VKTQQEENRLSTSALARRLEIPAQQLFATLRDYGWIQRAGDAWLLTPKGEYEGGRYQHSRRYGRYIVWPESVEGHPLLCAIESNQRISAASMCRYYPRLHARQINRALAELGLQHHTLLGWELTGPGRSLGGQQEESEASGAFYVTWPHELVDNPVIHRELTRQSDQSWPAQRSGEEEPDLFAGGAAEAAESEWQGIDGHLLQTPMQRRVCNWLYLAQLAHAYRRALPTEEVLCADFYLPEGSIYIDCWESEVAAGELGAKLRKRELYRQLKLRHLEINPDDMERLDEVLGRGLLAYGIRR
jgi:hypothetical protein